jgi:hypothetical protein
LCYSTSVSVNIPNAIAHLHILYTQQQTTTISDEQNTHTTTTTIIVSDEIVPSITDLFAEMPMRCTLDVAGVRNDLDALNEKAAAAGVLVGSLLFSFIFFCV